MTTQYCIAAVLVLRKIVLGFGLFSKWINYLILISEVANTF